MRRRAAEASPAPFYGVLETVMTDDGPVVRSHATSAPPQGGDVGALTSTSQCQLTAPPAYPCEGNAITGSGLPPFWLTYLIGDVRLRGWVNMGEKPSGFGIEYWFQCRPIRYLLRNFWGGVWSPASLACIGPQGAPHTEPRTARVIMGLTSTSCGCVAAGFWSAETFL